MARSASTCPSKEAVCSVGGICPPNPLTRMPFLPTASSGASWHDFVKLMSPQFVKPYVQSQKNDPNDAAGICEAVERPRMRGVPVKSITQQDEQALHRIR